MGFLFYDETQEDPAVENLFQEAKGSNKSTKMVAHHPQKQIDYLYAAIRI